MKKIVWLLLLANIAAFVYYKNQLWAPTTVRVQTSLNAEQLHVVEEVALNSYPLRKVPPMAAPVVEDIPVTTPASAPVAQALPAEVTACYEWGSFANANVNLAVDEANKLGVLHIVQSEQAGTDHRRYWIYKPPLPTPEAAQTKAEELRRLGVEDFFIVQDAKWRNAISFGVFKDEKLADALLEKLKQKGVRLLVKATRFGGEGHASLMLKEVSKRQLANLKKSQPQFPDAELKEVACRPA